MQVKLAVLLGMLLESHVKGTARVAQEDITDVELKGYFDLHAIAGDIIKYWPELKADT